MRPWNPADLRGFKNGAGTASSPRFVTITQFYGDEPSPSRRQVCATTVGMPQNLLLADRRDMEHIIEVVRKIQAHSGALVKASG